MRNEGIRQEFVPFQDNLKDFKLHMSHFQKKILLKKKIGHFKIFCIAIKKMYYVGQCPLKKKDTGKAFMWFGENSHDYYIFAL